MQLHLNCIAIASRLLLMHYVARWLFQRPGVATRNGNQGLLIITFILDYPCHQYITQDAKKRKSIADAIEAMTPDNLYRIALSGDHGEVGLVALRIREVKDRDPAVEMSDVRGLMEELDNLFLKAKILCEARAETPSGALAEPQSEILATSRVFGSHKTATQIVHA